MAKYVNVDELGLGKLNRNVFLLKPEYADGWNAVIDVLENAPTADVVKVVRCKDCKYRHQTTCPFLIANAYKTSTDDDFCSRGERREDE